MSLGLLISTFTILLIVAIGDIIGRFVPQVSSTYINVLLGLAVTFVPALNHAILDFNNDIFMIAILAPLLFFEGQRTPIQMVGKRAKSILGTAVFLALISSIIAAFVIHVAFALPAALSLVIIAICTPTDATAFESVVSGRQFQKSLKKTLQLESLFNDATGLILLQAGLIWVRTGHLNIWDNVGELIFSAGGGILVGVGLAFMIMFFRQSLVRSSKNVISSQTLIYVMTPVIIYLLAEKIGVSGIIAVVSAGLVDNSEAARSRFSSPRQMHLGIQIVNFMSQVLNSFVFAVLGVNLGRIIQNQYQTGLVSARWLIVGGLSYLVLLLCRGIYARFFVGQKNFRSSCLFALGGVHGTVTLAMTFSIMSAGVSQVVFNFVILVETVVIVLSMLVPTILFRFVLPKDWDEKRRQVTIQRLREQAVRAGINSVSKMQLAPALKELVYFDLQDQVQSNSLHTFWGQWRNVTTHEEVLSHIQSVAQRRALMRAFSVERQYLYDIAKRHVVASEYVYEVYNEILLAESLVLDPDNQLI